MDTMTQDILDKIKTNVGCAKSIDDKEKVSIAKLDNMPMIAKEHKVEREFIEILTNYQSDDLCSYPEYRGKPYFSIHYRENGEEFVGYGTYKIEVLSRYLRDYFFRG